FGPNQFSGISFSSFSANPSEYIQVINNYIGVGLDGVSEFQNSNHGIWSWNSNHFVIKNNIISTNVGNNRPVFDIQNRSNILVYNNQTPSQIIGNVVLGSRNAGIYVMSSSQLNIGGASANDGNSIQRSQSHGIYITASQNIAINGNHIGTNSSGTVNLGNQRNGIYLDENSNNITIGLTRPNQIAFNQLNGIEINSNTSRFNTIRFNKIFCNGQKGIKLSNQANENILPPIITNVSSPNQVSGEALPMARVDLYYIDSTCNDCSGNPQGLTYIGFTTANGSGIWNYSGSISSSKITATQTNASASTSEFSNCLILNNKTVTLNQLMTLPNGQVRLTAMISGLNSNFKVMFEKASLSDLNEWTVFETFETSQSLAQAIDFFPNSNSIYRVKVLTEQDLILVSNFRIFEGVNSQLVNIKNQFYGVAVSNISDEPLDVVVFDMNGKSIYETQIPKSVEHYELKLNGLSTGVYIIHFSNNQIFQTIKWLKSRD
ncbi:MAG: T9SS type A sorting domain-containing protein, partial [Cytophagales bacterium]